MLAIVNGTVLTVTKGTLERGTVLIDGDRIRAVGQNVRVPKGAETLDATGKVVLPGMIDAHTHVGVIVEGAGPAGVDANDNGDAITPHLHVIDAIDPEDLAFRDALEAGITAVGVTPGSANVVAGQIAAVSTVGRTVDEMVLNPQAGLKIAFGENPKNAHSSKGRFSTRMGVAAALREALTAAQGYRRKRAKTKRSVDRNLKHEVLAAALSRKLVVRAHAHKAHDILTVLRIAKEFKLKVVIDHGTEGHKIADELARAGIPVVIGPIFSTRRKVELQDRSLRTPGILARAGVRVAITTDHPVAPIHLLPVSAAIAVRYGMDPDDALRAITINPAAILGIDNELGSLEPGKRADVVVMSGHPFDFMSRVEAVFVGGKRQPIETVD